MQKNIIALAIAAAFAVPAVAMADVTVFGSMDGGVRYQANDSKTGNGSTTGLMMGQYNTARWGFKAVDDLGDGMKANVHLETSLQPASVGAPGANAGNPYGLIFDRQATIGLSTADSKFDMGWNYTLGWNTVIANDPFAGKFNDVTYVKPASGGVRAVAATGSTKMGDLTVAGQYVMNNEYSNPTTTMTATNPTGTGSMQASTGSAAAFSVAYAGGPVNVAAAYTATEAEVGKVNSSTYMTVGGGFNFGDGKVSAGYANKATKTADDDSTNTTMWLGASYSMSSAVAVTAAYYKNTSNTGSTAAATATNPGSNDTTKNRMMAMVTYNLSKKTNVYVEVDRETANFGATGSEDVLTSGLSLGLASVF